MFRGTHLVAAVVASFVVISVAGCAAAPPRPPTPVVVAADRADRAGNDAAADAADAADAEADSAIAAWRAERVAHSDAARVAAADSGPVRFTDEVVAVSHGNGVVYLSFGRPYPEQVLSVRLAIEVWNALESRAMLHREVQISGLLEHGAGGPIVVVSRADDVGIVPVDEGVLNTPCPELVAVRPRHLRLALQQRLESSPPNDPALPDLLEGLYQCLDAVPPAHTNAFLFFDALDLDTKASDEQFIRRWGQLSAWRAASPSSVGASLAEAMMHISRGWAIRGTRTIVHVTPTQRKQFAEALDRASAVLEAQPAVTETSTGWSLWQMIALGEGWSTTRYDALFADAVAAFPGHVPFYVAAAYRLLPHWYGVPGSMEAFVDAQRALVGGVDGDMLYAQVAWAMDGHYPHAIFQRTALSWPTTARGLEALIAKGGSNVAYWRNVYAHLAVEANDLDRLGPALDAMGDDADMSVWVNLQNVQRARQRVQQGARAREAADLESDDE